MALICDTSGLYALYDAADEEHEATRSAVESETGPLLVPVILLAEIDFLLHSRLGPDAALDFIEAVKQGEFTLVPLIDTDVARSLELMTQYRDLGIGLADATIVDAAERLHVTRLLSHDQRHFRVIRPRGIEHFSLLPADME
jgi:predicted nucleic acid-binding protein